MTSLALHDNHPPRKGLKKRIKKMQKIKCSEAVYNKILPFLKENLAVVKYPGSGGGFEPRRGDEVRGVTEGQAVCDIINNKQGQFTASVVHSGSPREGGLIEIVELGSAGGLNKPCRESGNI
jgi:hypothetical protein